MFLKFRRRVNPRHEKTNPKNQDFSPAKKIGPTVTEAVSTLAQKWSLLPISVPSRSSERWLVFRHWPKTRQGPKPRFSRTAHQFLPCRPRAKWKPPDLTKTPEDNRLNRIAKYRQYFNDTSLSSYPWSGEGSGVQNPTVQSLHKIKTKRLVSLKRETF